MLGISLDAGAKAVNKTVSLTLGNLYSTGEERKQYKGGDFGAPKQVIFLPRDLKVFSIQLKEQINEHLYGHVNQEHNLQEETFIFLFF